ncbi:SA1362 family protein [Pontibacillus litoralis]|uniref:Uncharacterized protein n=1 Tax=Pontibacillus litoralis JSM 072002 TaxID=1385512 RepID=A0A0A5GCL3_9BACI|nr:SA1362 family protein [Pontibacillus litoralis]KGX88855.1 hypothetical protein N784_00445 [Pontibacillus litoralis JSM 072002]
MFQKVAKPLFFTIIGLAIVGIAYELMTNAGAFFTQMLITIGIAVVIISILYFIMNKFVFNQSNDMKHYRKAVRQSKMKYGKTKSSSIKNKTKPTTFKNKTSVKSEKLTKNRPRKKPSHLRVIEGNKNKKKDRASL